MHVKYKALMLVGVVTILTAGISGWSSYATNSGIIESAKQKELRGTATLIQNDLQEQATKAAARASLVVSLPSIQDAFRKGDREQLIQAVLNIAQNATLALRGGPADGGTPFTGRIARGDARLAMRTRVARQATFGRQRFRLALELHIEDNGPGVPEDIRDRIFNPLVSGREGGSGLGLTLAQTFVQQHQGTIECDSVPGRTVFKILIPLP